MILELSLMMLPRFVWNLVAKVITCISSLLEILISVIKYSRQDVLLKHQKPQFSGPWDVERCIENFGKTDVKIELLTWAYSDCPTYMGLAERHMFSIIFKVLTNQDLTFNYIIALVTRYYPEWSFSDEMVFLLVDHPTDQMQLFSRAGILRNSREKGIYQLDLKILSAFCICFRSLTRLFQIPMCDTIRDVDQFTMGDDANGANLMIPECMIKELVYWCIKINGKEEIFFTPFKLKMHELFIINNKHNLSILKYWHLKYLGKEISFDRIISQPSSMPSPLIRVQELVDNGHLDPNASIEEIDQMMNAGMDREASDHDYKEESKSLSGNGVRIARGECLIINQIFENVRIPELKSKWRPGSEHDEEVLVRTWNKLGCRKNIRVERDLTIDEISKVLKEFRQKLKSSKPDFIVIAVLGHGKRDNVTGTEYIMDIIWQGFSVNKIKNMFVDGHNCPVMLGKPKFFIFQACRGKNRQVPMDHISSLTNMQVDADETDGEQDDEKMIEQDGIQYPHKSWFMAYNSTIEGYVSLRNRAQGSIFIQALCKKLNDQWYHTDISSIASEVNKEIMQNYGRIQAPIFENQLGDKVYFDVLKMYRSKDE